MKRLYFYTLCLLILGCNPISEANLLEVALQAAGNNRPELEQVLDHYKNDPEKLEAARFLIRNMPYYYYYEGELLDNHLKQYELLGSTHRSPHDIRDSLNKMYGRFSIHSLHRKMDIQEIDSAYLVDNIEDAFRVWKEQPWGKNVSFNDFCEYILPYRIGDEKLPIWRKELYEKYNPVLDSLRKRPDADDPRMAAQFIMDTLCREPSRYTGELPATPHAGPQICVTWKSGTCRELSDAVIYIMRALGIPCGQDGVVMRGNNNASHFWNFFLDKKKDTYTAELPYPNINKANSMETPKGKVYRNTFSVNWQELNNIQKITDFIPPFFQLPKQKDVTNLYADSLSFTIKIPAEQLYEDIPPPNVVYLCLSSWQNWVPAAWTAYNKDSICFQNVEGDVVFRLGSYTGKDLKMISDPFFMDRKSGEIRFFEPQKEKEKVTVLFKFHFFYEIYLDRMVGGIIEASDNSCFNQPDTLYQIRETPMRLITKVSVKPDKKYRYIRYKGPKNSYCNISEMAVFENRNDTIPLTGKVIGTLGCFDYDGKKHDYTVVFDGDPYTSFDYLFPDGGWSGIDLGVPRQISRISYTPRNSDNYIRKGDTYELFYLDKEWISSGLQTAISDSLDYLVPKGSLLYLKNHTRGKDERIFEYKDGKQTFW